MIGPWLRNLQSKTLEMKEANHRLIAALDSVSLRNVTMKRLGCPECPLGLLRLLNELRKLLDLFTSKYRGALPGKQPIDATFIESIDPFSQGTLAHKECFADLSPTDTGNKQLNRCAT